MSCRTLLAAMLFVSLSPAGAMASDARSIFNDASAPGRARVELPAEYGDAPTATSFSDAACSALRDDACRWRIPARERGQSDAAPIVDDLGAVQPAAYAVSPGTYSMPGVCCPPPPETWAMVAPYGWLSAMDGAITVFGTPVPVDVSLSDVVQLLKNDLRGAAMVQFEAGRGDWGVLFNGMILSLSSDRSLAPLDVTVDIDATFLEAFLFYRLVNSTQGDVPWTVDLLGGARYYDLDFSTRFFAGPIGPVSFGQSHSWVDLVFGVRSSVMLTEQLELFGRGDIGGFGIGTSSDPAWNVQGGLKYHVAAIEGLSLGAGYKLLDVREYQHAGTPIEWGFNVRMHGPFAALVYQF